MSTSRTNGVRLMAGTAVGALALTAVAALPGAASAAASAAPTAAAAASSATAAPGVTVVSNELELRRAVQAANQRPGVDRIQLDSRITFSRGRLTNGGSFFGDLDVLGPLVIDGAGRVIDARSVDRVFDVRPAARLVLKDLHLRNGRAGDGESGGAVRSEGRLVLRHSTVAGSVVSGDGASGGAIFNDDGTLVLMNSRLTNNQSARAGGAIEANGGDTTVVESRLTRNNTGSGPGNGGAPHLTGAGNVYVAFSRIARNTAASEGGGLWNSADGTFLVDRSEVVANAAAGATSSEGGGGLYNDGGELTVINSKVRGNDATGAAGSGGGILSVAGSLEVEETSLAGNHSQRAGGAVEIGDGDVTVLRSSLIGNDAGAAPGNGGGLHVTGAATILVGGSLVADNTARSEGGGLWNQAGSTMTVRNTELSGNTAAGPDADNGGGALFNNGGDLAVRGSEISDNAATGAAGSGGALLTTAGAVEIDETTISGNTSVRAGGGIEAVVGDITVRRSSLTGNSTGGSPGNGGAFHITGAGTVLVAASEVTGNTAAREGGGLWNQAGTTMTVRNSDIGDNTASGPAADDGGAGLFNNGGELVVIGSTVDGNVADGAAGSGGGVLNLADGVLRLNGTSFEGNSSVRAGGAVETSGGTVMLTDVDASGNTTGDSPGNGGALHITGAGDVAWTRGTVTGNTAANQGGGVWNSDTGVLALVDVTIEGNVAPNGGPNIYTVPGGTTTENGVPAPNR